MNYSEKLKDPRWQKKRLEILQRDKWSCQICESIDKTLHVHHFYYERDKDPWDYPNMAFLTLCEECHQSESEERPKEEYLLIGELRRSRFLANNLLDLAAGFHYVQEAHLTQEELSFLSSALNWKLLNKDSIMNLISDYQEWLKKIKNMNFSIQR